MSWHRPGYDVGHPYSRYCHPERSEASLCPSRETLAARKRDKTFPVLVVKNHYRAPTTFNRNHGEAVEYLSCVRIDRVL